MGDWNTREKVLRCNEIPKSLKSVLRLLKAEKVKLPQALLCKGVCAATRKKLTESR